MYSTRILKNILFLGKMYLILIIGYNFGNLKIELKNLKKLLLKIRIEFKKLNKPTLNCCKNYQQKEIFPEA